jgi:glycine/D-amino acid oxidase-like deaminating enzyme
MATAEHRSRPAQPPAARPSHADYEAGRVPIARSAWPAPGKRAGYPALTQDLDVDVLVIGAGLAGASLALHLAERGVDVALLEARQPADGASGRNAGHVQPTFGSAKIFRGWPDRGRRFADYLVQHRDIVFELCHRHGIEGDAEKCGIVNAAHREQGPLLAEMAQWKRRGYDVEVIGGGRLRELLGTERYAWGLHWREGGRLNPHMFTSGMVAAAARHGARVFGDSPVESCERAGARWRARTARGSVTARKVLICTNGHAGNAFLPELARTQYRLLACGLATKPLPRELLEIVNPARVAMTQEPLGLYPLVIDGRNRLVSATIPGAGRADDAQRYFRYLLRFLHRTWPATRDVPIELETYWTGMTANSSSSYDDGHPRLYQVADGVLALMNLGTWGNLLGPLLGMNVAHALADDRPQDFLLPLEAPSAVASPGRFEFKIRRVLIPMARLLDRFERLKV